MLMLMRIRGGSWTGGQAEGEILAGCGQGCRILFVRGGNVPVCQYVTARLPGKHRQRGHGAKGFHVLLPSPVRVL